MKIHLDRVGDRIWMACDFRGDMPKRAKRIVGMDFLSGSRAIAFAERFSLRRAPKGCWSFPLNWRTCLDLRHEFGDEQLVIEDSLWEWSALEKDRRGELLKLRAVDEFPTPVLEKAYPRLNEAVHNRKFQSVGIGFAMCAGHSVNGDHPGLGKTLQAIGAAVESELSGPILVVAPSVAATVTWPDEMREWAPDEVFTVVEGSRDQREATISRFRSLAEHRAESRTWLFINTEMLQVERPPVRKRKGKNAKWEDWLGVELDDALAIENGLPDAAGLLEALDLGTVAVEPAEGSPADVAAQEYEKLLEDYDPTARRYPDLFEIIWSAVIVDESHKILPAKSSLAKKQSQTRSGIQKIPVRTGWGMRKLAMSGTPWRGNPLNQWGALNWLDPIQYSSFGSYALRWFEVEEEQHSGDPDDTHRVIEGIRPEVAKEYGEEMDVTMLRRTKAEVAPWLPSKVYGGTHLVPGDRRSPIGVWLDMGPKQALAYEQMTRDAVARLESGDLQAIGVLAEMTRQKQFACSLGDVTRVLRKFPGNDLREWADTFAPALPSNKWDWIVEFLDERGIAGGKDEWGDGKVVIGAWQTGLLNIFRKQLDRMKIPSLIITGETKNADRGAAKNRFQRDGGPRVFLLNTNAGGVSLTLDKADDMIICDETWTPDDQEQLEDRIHRISRGEGRAPATYWYLRSRGTIDEHIAQTTADKDEIQKMLMDGRRGVAYAKQLLTGGQ